MRIYPIFSTPRVGRLIMGISQSGASPDICEMMAEARKKGTLTIAIVNHVDSPMAIQAFYVMVARLAVARGYDPDSPDNLKKVTETR